MKTLLILERKELPSYKYESLIKRLKNSAKEHGYRSFLLFGWVRYKDFVLNNWSRKAPWNGMRIKMQRNRGVQIGKNVHFGSDITIDHLYPNYVRIEDHAGLAGNNYILTHTKPSSFHSSFIESYVAPVIIHKHTWIAVGATILPGVEVGEGSIVAAGSIVYKDVPPLTMVAGNPAKVIHDLAKLLKRNYSPEDFSRIISERKEKYGL